MAKKGFRGKQPHQTQEKQVFRGKPFTFPRNLATQTCPKREIHPELKKNKNPSSLYEAQLMLKYRVCYPILLGYGASSWQKTKCITKIKERLSPWMEKKKEDKYRKSVFLPYSKFTYQRNIALCATHFHEGRQWLTHNL